MSVETFQVFFDRLPLEFRLVFRTIRKTCELVNDVELVEPLNPVQSVVS